MKWTKSNYSYLQQVAPSDLRKGEQIEQDEITSKKLSDSQFLILVPSQSSGRKYKVQVTFKKNQLDIECNCPAYDRVGDCKHSVAAELHFQKMESDSDSAAEDLRDEPEDEEVADTHHITFKSQHLNLIELQRLAGNSSKSEIDKLLRKTELVNQELNQVFFYVKQNANNIYDTDIEFDGNESYTVSCNCGKNGPGLCAHGLAGFYYISRHWGDRFFKKKKDFTEKKKRILSAYGLTLDDPEASLFTWSENYYGQFVLQGKPDFIVPAGNATFLAGGVGLNLTASDYVYLVDPWWNPAAEQQAIDRTHRIGQTRKIFAYKMICKDTVEEKILQLQKKKKALANELVSEEAGFVKKLTRDDIAFLFS